MSLPSFSMRQLLEAGVHFGHHTRRWNPRMAPFIYGVRNNVHIIDLQQSVPLLQRALQALRDTAAKGGRILFVATKRQASPLIAKTRDRCGQFFVNHRWLGGMLTNWATIKNSIQRLKELESKLGDDKAVAGFTKKELLDLQRQRDKLERALGGIKEMSDRPDLIVVIDTNKEKIAIDEAKTLGIPVVAVLDSNCDPDGITYPVPGNDDALRAIELYLELFWGAVLDGIAEEAAKSGVDMGTSESAPAELAVEAEKPSPEAPQATA
jgi:small subunit ribosomal protein S2